MRKKPTILVVEDNSFIIENVYKEYLKELDLLMEYALSKREAIEKIRCKTYDVAFVDIMLREDQNDRGGVEVIEYLYKLNEGTAIIVVSATDDIRVALTTYKAGIVDFIQKGELHNEKDLQKPLEKILNNYGLYKPNYLGKYISLSAYLASPELTPYWEHEILTTLNLSFDVMVRTLNNSLENFLPVLRNKNTVSSFTTDSQKNCINGMFWSKGVGFPIWFSMAHQNGTIVEPPIDLKGDVLYEYKKGKVQVLIWKLLSVKRDEFVESIWEEAK